MSRDQDVRQGEHRERIVAQKLAAAWRCDWGRMGPWSPIDVYFMRDGRIVSQAEIRTLNRNHDRWPHFFIDLDKWFPLMQAEVMLRQKAFYVIAFYDGVFGVRIGTLPVSDFRYLFRGRTDRPDAPNDLSPVIEVPTTALKRICDSTGIFEAAPSLAVTRVPGEEG